VKVRRWGSDFARELAGWRYDPPYDFYDLASDPHDAEEMRDPQRRHHFRAVVGDDGLLDAFWYFDRSGDVVEIGLGLRPDLTGRGLGEEYVRAELDYARRLWAPSLFRLYVTTWNRRAIRLYERLGFRETGRETRSFELVGEHEFLQMERPS
jgi:RimJ/RimL family protein N-acetyltransferase